MKKNKYLYLLITTIISFTFLAGNVYAAGYTISISPSSVTKGKSATLYLKCTDSAGGYSISSSNSNVASVSDERIWCENGTETISLKTTITGTATITVKPISVSDSNGNDLSLPTKTATIKVTEPVVVTKSSNANLSGLEVEGTTLSPEFNSDTKDYTVDLEAATTKINIKATAADRKATITGAGERDVVDGANKLEIVVTAEDGTTKTYNLVANVKELNPITTKVNNQEYTVIRKKSELPKLETFDETTVKIGEEDVVAYYNDKLKLTLVGLKDSKGDIALYIYDKTKKTYTKYEQITVGSTSLYLKKSKLPNSNYKAYSITLNNIETTIYKLHNNSKVGLIYGFNLTTGTEGYYTYNKNEESLQLYYDDEINIYKNKAHDLFIYLIVSISITILIILISLISLIVRRSKRKKKLNYYQKMNKNVSI